MNEAAATHREVMILFYALAATTGYVVLMFGVVFLKLSNTARKLDLILRKLNNSQPDDEGGY